MNFLILFPFFFIYNVNCGIHNYDSFLDQYQGRETVQLDFFYESLCPDSIEAYVKELRPTVQKLNSYLNLRTYPFGKAYVGPLSITIVWGTDRHAYIFIWRTAKECNSFDMFPERYTLGLFKKKLNRHKMNVHAPSSSSQFPSDIRSRSNSCYGRLSQIQQKLRRIADKTEEVYVVRNKDVYAAVPNDAYVFIVVMRNKSGRITFHCQHGPYECYGNALHVCAIDILKKPIDYVNFIACLMTDGSTDNATDKCGHSLFVNPEYIKNCARSNRAVQLLKMYAHQTELQRLKYVPYILINGQEYDYSKPLMRQVCGAFKTPPKECYERFN